MTDVGAELELVYRCEAARRPGAPQSGAKSRSRQAGEGTTTAKSNWRTDRCAPFLLLACGLWLAACCCFGVPTKPAWKSGPPLGASPRICAVLADVGDGLGPAISRHRPPSPTTEGKIL